MFQINRHITKIIFTLLILCGSVGYAQVWPVSDIQGSGSPENPWLIRTAEDLHALALFVNESQANANATSNMHFRLMNNIDLTEFLGTVVENPRGWEPIGRGLDLKANRRHAFQGHFHGGGHVISGLRINRHNTTENLSENFFIGLFGIIENATIDSLGVEVAEGDSVRGGNFTGILVGSAHWNSRIEQVYTKGKVSGQLFVGGLAGKLGYSNVINSYSTANVYGVSRNIGGLVGTVYFGGSVRYSYAAGNVQGYAAVGGLLGYVRHSNSMIHNVFVASANVKGSESVGRLIGYNFEATTDLSNLHVSSTLAITGNIGYYYGGAGIAFESLRDQGFFTNPANWRGNAWDFENVWTMEPDGFPVFRWRTATPAPLLPPVLDTIMLTDDATMWPLFDPNVFEYDIDLACGGRNHFTFYFEAGEHDTIHIYSRFGHRSGVQRMLYLYETTEGDVSELTVRVNNPHTDSVLTYRFTIRMPYDSIRIIRPFDHILEVINRPDVFGGQAFKENGYFQWYRNGISIPGANRGILYIGHGGVGSDRFSVMVTHLDGTTNMVCPRSWEVEVNNLQVFPNPTQGHLTVMSESRQQASRIEVFTICGRLVHVVYSSADQTELNLTHLQPGTYIVRQNGQTAVIVVTR